MSDRAYVANAKAAWQRILDREDWDAATLSTAAALWASLNAERLLQIAEGKAK